jgi:hypothetical protein
MFDTPVERRRIGSTALSLNWLAGILKQVTGACLHNYAQMANTILKGQVIPGKQQRAANWTHALESRP